MEKLNVIIAHYKKWKKDNPDTWIIYCKSLDNLEDVIRYSALSENHLGKRNNHQRRLKKNDLRVFAENLLEKKEEIKSAKTFDELLNIVETCKVNGIGELACYDTANRIGTKLNIVPVMIYLHAGARIGIEKILNRKIKEKAVTRRILPNPFHDKNLTDAEIEDILCIYKDKFDSIT